MHPFIGLVCFNNFYYCRFHRLKIVINHGQYASIISTIVDIGEPPPSVLGQYASIISTIVDLLNSRTQACGLVCFNNFYYCRFTTSLLVSAKGQYASIISTIVDWKSSLLSCSKGQYASIISTIVDSLNAFDNLDGLVCFNNFYYCRSNELNYQAYGGQYASIISTIVDMDFADSVSPEASMLQ